MPLWYAADLEQYERDSCFRLVSNTNKVISLQVEIWEHLLFIADSSLEAGPATIALDDYDFITLKTCLGRSKCGFYKKSSLLVEQEDDFCMLDWGRSVPKVFSPVHLLKADRILIRQSINKYRMLLAEKELSSSAAVLLELDGGEDYFRQHIGQSFPLVIKSLLTRDQEAFIKYCRSLVGLGRGLTPTGDDLLYGAIVAFHYFVNDSAFLAALKDEFRALTLNTNVFGRHALEMAFRGLTLEMYGFFLKTIGLGEADKGLLNRIFSLGSSSGVDAAIAMLYFLKILTDAWFFDKPVDGNTQRL